jgi:hypothetical protein
MPWVGFELTFPASERAKTVDALDRAATVTGLSRYTDPQTHVHQIKKIEDYSFLEECF